MYSAKARGKGRVVVFEPSMHDAVMARAQLSADLEHAIAAREFMLQYQPIVEIATGRMVGVEALVRWEHPERGRIGPDDFIRVAEESDSILEIGRWVLGQACRQMRGWQRPRRARTDSRVNVNISARQLAQPDFVDEVLTIIREAGVDPAAIVLEMTETSMLQDSAATREKLQDLRDAGIGVSIDDFGTGYSSLSYLQRFPVTTLKIARDFVHVDGLDPDAWELASAIVALGRALRLSVIAEGVEQWSQLGRLRTLGCEYAQGFYFARPLDPAAIETLLAQGSILERRPRRPEAALRDRLPGRAAEAELTARVRRPRVSVPAGTEQDFRPIGHRPAGHASSRHRRQPDRLSPIRSANSANPSKGGDAKPGIFREPAPEDRPVARHRTSTDPEGGHRWRRWNRHESGWHVPSDSNARRPWLEPGLRAHPATRRRTVRRRSSPRRSSGGHSRRRRRWRRLRPGRRRELDGQHDRLHGRDGVVGRRATPAQGVDVAIIDTGVTPVEGLATAGKVVYGPDLSLESQAPDLTQPRHERPRHVHGRHHRRSGRRPHAPYADAPAVASAAWPPTPGSCRVKVGVADGGTDVSQVIAAIDWVVQHRTDNGLNIRVLNLSYGTNSAQDYTVDPLAFAVEQAWKAGIFVVAAAGNYGLPVSRTRARLADPAVDPHILAVGASELDGHDDRRATTRCRPSRADARSDSRASTSSRPARTSSGPARAGLVHRSATVADGPVSDRLLPRQRDERGGGVRLRGGRARDPASARASRPDQVKKLLMTTARSALSGYSLEAAGPGRDRPRATS